MAGYEWQTFVCHASEDKELVARPLANLLAERGVKVWLDEAEIRLGDSLREKIDAGLARSRFGVVILSPAFFAKRWPRAELDGLIAKEADGTKAILPVWHEVSEADVRNFSPILAGRKAAKISDGIGIVAREILKALDEAGVGNPAAPELEGRLTKQLLLSLPEGAFLLGNFYDQDLRPLLAEVVPPLRLRDAYWRHIREQGNAGSRCYVFKDVDHYRAHMTARGAFLSKKRPRARSTQDGLSIDFNIEVARSLLAAAQAPPAAWTRFIKELRFEDGRHKFERLDAFSSLDHLELLDLLDAEITSLEGAQGLKRLKWLDLGEARLSDITPLAGLRSLEHLSLGTARPTSLDSLAELRRLKRLELNGVQISDIAPIGGLHDLEYLDLARTLVSDLSPLSGLSRLKYLNLWGTPVVNIEPISQLSGLRVLDIDRTRVQHVACLRRLRNLRFLDVFETEIVDESSLEHLRDLCISRGLPFPPTLKIDPSEDWQRWYWRHVLGVPEEQLAELVAATDGSPDAVNKLYWDRI